MAGRDHGVTGRRAKEPRATPSRRGRRRVWGRHRRQLVLAVLLIGLVGGLVVALGVTRPVSSESAALTAPVRIRVVPSDTTAKATWPLSGSAQSFRVEYGTSPDFLDAEIAVVARGPVDLTSLSPGTTYFLRVSAVGEGRSSTPSRPIQFATEYSASPPKPRVGVRRSTAAKVDWTPVGRGLRYETHFDDEPTFTNPRTSGGRKTSARFTELDPGTTYWTRVRAVDDDGVAQSEWSEVISKMTPKSEPMGVGTYNILKWRKNNWSARRAPVANLIKSSSLDVVGLQEATPSHIPSGPRQFEDVVNALGPNWAVTRTSGDATGETRTVYDQTKQRLVAEGYQTIAGSSRFRGIPRYVAWAVFEQISTKKRFLFVNTHLTPGRGRAEAGNRAVGARQIVNTVRQINNDDLPVVIVGDFNTGLPRTSSNAVYATITGSGFVDPLLNSGKLGQAEKQVNADLKTVNNLRRTAPRRPNPALVDHIFVSPMRVSQWQVAANLDGAGRFIGTIPSDHHLVRATVYLP